MTFTWFGFFWGFVDWLALGWVCIGYIKFHEFACLPFFSDSGLCLALMVVSCYSYVWAFIISSFCFFYGLLGWLVVVFVV